MFRINQFQDQQSPTQFKDRLKKRSLDQNIANNTRLYTYPHRPTLINQVDIQPSPRKRFQTAEDIWQPNTMPHPLRILPPKLLTMRNS